jgi:acetyl-CoA C-acetyltransferase
MSNTVILSSARTPFGKINGGLAPKTAVELGTIALQAAIDRARIERELIEHVTFGQVLQAGAGQNPARQVGFNAGLPKTVTSETVNRVCGSGMRALAIADMTVRLGDASVIAVGGMESLSNAPYALPKARAGYRGGHGVLVDIAINDGLTSAGDGCLMGEQGSAVAAEEGISREEQDAWALRSHQLALAAIDSGRFEREIVPVTLDGRKGSVTIDTDEAPRRDTSLDALARLAPAFGEDSTVTAGNAPGLNDGAAALIVADDRWAQEHGAEIRATILGYGHAAWDPPYLAYTPAMATEKALTKAGLTIDDVDLVEINEAFSSVPIISSARLGISTDKVNINGGAVALGHPFAASGGRIVLTLIESLRERGGGIGVAAICSGGGLGDAVVLRVDG